MKKITSSIAVLIIGLIALIAFVLISNKSEEKIPQGISAVDSQVQIANVGTLNELVSSESQEQSEISEIEEKIMKATFKTNKGSFELELFEDLAPNTVANFVKLAESDFYTGVKFHRVIEGFMIQGGDPLTKDDEQVDFWGTGGPGYKFEDEIHAENRNVIGTISMANAGPNTNGSQFFINTANNDFLDTKHTVFGKVTSGMEIVSAIEVVEKFPNDRPVEAVVIESVIISK
jgi:cyclophilin family peptidyl-prolyl cis-trans isomerase